MTIIEKLLTLIFCHLVGDYVLQVDFIAKTKGTNWYHLFVHCALYTLPLFVAFGFTWHLAVIFLAHCIIDPIKARWQKINYPIDQILHYITLFIYFI